MISIVGYISIISNISPYGGLPKWGDPQVTIVMDLNDLDDGSCSGSRLVNLPEGKS